MDTTIKPPAVLSLCTGMRGLERGLERAIGSINTIAYVEIEAVICFNLVKQMEQGILDPVPIWTNLKTFDWPILRGKVDIITGGYPCQPFSVAGKQRGAEDPRHLWLYIKEGVRAVRPVCCFFENVPGHLTLGYEEVRRDLQGLGYKVKEGIYSAAEVGAPHIRKRLFILAILSDEEGTRWRKKIMDNAMRGRHGRSQEKIFAEWNSLKPSGKELANPNSSRGGENTEQSELRTNSAEQSSSDRWFAAARQDAEEPIERWPARSGEQQYYWEEPRTTGFTNRLPSTVRTMWSRCRKGFAKMLGEKIWQETDFRIKSHFESPVGVTVNGYNYREDLLRMAGNGVVEQCAEFAFIDLLFKILK